METRHVFITTSCYLHNTIYYFILQLLTVEEDGLMGRHIETCLPCRCSSGQWQLPHPEGF